jgi:tRNA-splicing endonuclease subunit Sen34
MVQMTVSEPFPIFQIAQRCLLFNIDAISHIRREHHICGVLVGNIPQATQQTVFSGIPLELMPEEAQLLVENGHAFLVDDVAAHNDANFSGLTGNVKAKFLGELGRQGIEAAEAYRQQSMERKNAYLSRVSAYNKIGAAASGAIDPMLVTPTTSYPPLQAPRRSGAAALPRVPSSYPLFAHLHDKGYFMGPGLRFGCEYVAYPGDPLRYHSHFLVTGHGWEDEIDLLDIVGGGRLGTGVKKGYMIGGATPKDNGNGTGEVRTFSFEWAAM